MKKLFILLGLMLINALIHAAPPPAAEVFQFSVKRQDPNTFTLQWQIKPGYYLYQDRIKLTAEAEANVQLGDIRYPKPETKIDSRGRKYLVYRNQLTIPVAVLGQEPGESLLNLSYQGCADDGYCYPPEFRTIKVAINPALALSTVEIQTQETLAEPAELATQGADGLFTNHHWWMVFLSFYGLGLLLAFTPCVLPMVPVLSSIIVGHGADLTTRKAFWLSFSYVMAMAVTYALAGALISLLGANLQVLLQTPLTIGLFSLLFVLLSLSMFGLYELRLPVSWQAKLAQASRSQANGHYLGAALMGVLSTLILSPCVTAPLIGALTYIANTGRVLMGTTALFFLGLGMGTPLLMIGTSAGKFLPKTGLWMNKIKNLFGLVLLGVAIYLLGRILPGSLTLGIWACFFIFSGIFTGAFTPGTTYLDKAQQALGLILLILGITQLIGATMGNSDPVRPLAGWHSAAANNNHNQTTTVKTLAELEKALSLAKGSPVMLDYYADWCTSCKIMEDGLFQLPAVVQAVAAIRVIKVDVTANDAQSQALLKAYGVIAPPTFIFINPEGEELKQLRLYGEVREAEFLSRLKELD